MRQNSMKRLRGWTLPLIQIGALLLFAGTMFGQETTAGLQGTVKDQSGAVVPNASVTVTADTLIGDKTTKSDANGYYRFANLPPGTYAMTVKAEGFATEKRAGLVLEVGHLPTVDIPLQVGKTETVVEVSGEAPAIDVTTNHTMTNVTEDVLDNVPHGRSFQSVIQFSPMARNEPTEGMTTNGSANGGTGGSQPGSTGNGLTYGFSVGGSGDSENSYLVEGQDTENISGGYSKANVPYMFIQEVQVKTSGIEAEHGGALGGVVNVIMKKGGNNFHGALFADYEGDNIDANQNNMYLRYDPLDPGNAPARQDPGAQEYQGKKDHFRDFNPGFTVGGPILKDRLWFFLGFAPEVDSLARTINFGGTTGSQYFTRDTQTYYGTSRLDANLTQKIRLFASWLDQYARRTGSTMPIADPVAGDLAAGYVNQSTFSSPDSFSHGLGWVAPNSTYNFGADITLSPKIVSTTRFGYFFENYKSFGWQTTTPNLEWTATGTGDNTPNVPAGCGPQPNPVQCTGNSLPASVAQPLFTTTAPYTGTYTPFNSNKHYQFDQDVAFFKSGWMGTHNIKVGYQFNRLRNVISQNGNVPLVLMNVGNGNSYAPFTSTGAANCASLQSEWGVCAGQYGYLTVEDFSTILPQAAIDNNHALFAQDSWSVARGLTFNLGIRVEKESLPVPSGLQQPGVAKPQSIDFSWSDKIEPRLGVAWDPTNTGKAKIFGSYGVVNDVMKLLLAQTSWGAQAFEECSYALGPDGTSSNFTNADISSVFVNGRACPNGLPTQGANWAGGTVPASVQDAGSGVSLIENINLRPWEPVAPNVKPYRQHEYVAGVDYQLGHDWALEARYDRRRLDHVIEDASLADKVWGETYTVVNPGEGVNSTVNGYANFLSSLGQAYGVPGWAFNATNLYGPGAAFGTCSSCPPNPKAVRNYDGVEVRLTKSTSKGWAGMFSYTYSSLWGNYTGLTTSDQIDGGGTGRNSPDTTRSFDEPFYYFTETGKSANGPLPTDRPNTVKGYVYYVLPWKGMHTTFGLFQTAYQGTPMSSYIDVAGMFTGQVSEALYPWGRGQWVSETTDAAGNITLGTPHTERTPWYTQSDLNIAHEFKTGEHQALGFEANIFNVLGQHAILQYYEGLNSANFTTPLYPGTNASCVNSPNNPLGIVTTACGAGLYQTTETGYSVQQWINGNGQPATIGGKRNPDYLAPVIKSSWYGMPFQYQAGRSMRISVHYTF